MNPFVPDDDQRTLLRRANLLGLTCKKGKRGAQLARVQDVSKKARDTYYLRVGKKKTPRYVAALKPYNTLIRAPLLADCVQLLRQPGWDTSGAIASLEPPTPPVKWGYTVSSEDPTVISTLGPISPGQSQLLIADFMKKTPGLSLCNFKCESPYGMLKRRSLYTGDEPSFVVAYVYDRADRPSKDNIVAKWRVGVAIKSASSGFLRWYNPTAAKTPGAPAPYGLAVHYAGKVPSIFGLLEDASPFGDQKARNKLAIRLLELVQQRRAEGQSPDIALPVAQAVYIYFGLQGWPRLQLCAAGRQIAATLNKTAKRAATPRYDLGKLQKLADQALREVSLLLDSGSCRTANAELDSAREGLGVILARATVAVKIGPKATPSSSDIMTKPGMELAELLRPILENHRNSGDAMFGAVDDLLSLLGHKSDAGGTAVDPENLSAAIALAQAWQRVMERTTPTISLLLETLRNAQPASVEAKTWESLIKKCRQRFTEVSEQGSPETTFLNTRSRTGAGSIYDELTARLQKLADGARKRQCRAVVGKEYPIGKDRGGIAEMFEGMTPEEHLHAVVKNPQLCHCMQRYAEPLYTKFLAAVQQTERGSHTQELCGEEAPRRLVVDKAEDTQVFLDSRHAGKECGNLPGAPDWVTKLKEQLESGIPMDEALSDAQMLLSAHLGERKLMIARDGSKADHDMQKPERCLHSLTKLAPLLRNAWCREMFNQEISSINGVDVKGLKATVSAIKAQDLSKKYQELLVKHPNIRTSKLDACMSAMAPDWANIQELAHRKAASKKDNETRAEQVGLLDLNAILEGICSSASAISLPSFKCADMLQRVALFGIQLLDNRLFDHIEKFELNHSASVISGGYGKYARAVRGIHDGVVAIARDIELNSRKISSTVGGSSFVTATQLLRDVDVCTGNQYSAYQAIAAHIKKTPHLSDRVASMRQSLFYTLTKRTYGAWLTLPGQAHKVLEEPRRVLWETYLRLVLADVKLLKEVVTWNLLENTEKISCRAALPVARVQGLWWLVCLNGDIAPQLAGSSGVEGVLVHAKRALSAALTLNRGDMHIMNNELSSVQFEQETLERVASERTDFARRVPTPLLTCAEATAVSGAIMEHIGRNGGQHTEFIYENLAAYPPLTFPFYGIFDSTEVSVGIYDGPGNSTVVPEKILALHGNNPYIGGA